MWWDQRPRAVLSKVARSLPIHLAVFTGLYFGNTFALGGQEFAMMNPESFLFGDTSDLNFLSQLPGTVRCCSPQLSWALYVAVAHLQACWFR